MSTSKPVNEMNVFEKLHAVMKEMPSVSKDGTNSFHKYKYVSEGAYVRALRPLLEKYNLMVVPAVTQGPFSPPDNPELVHIMVNWTVVNIDDPSDKVTATIPASGSDKGDKAVYKAITGSKKYFINTLLMTESGDDPEADVETDKRAASKGKPAAKAAPAKTESKPSKTNFNPTPKPGNGFGV